MAVSTILPPSDDRLEQALVGETLRNSAAIKALGPLHPSHFVDPVHGELFEVISFRVNFGHPADLASLVSILSRCGFLEEVGGTAYLHQLAQLPPPPDMAAAAERVRDLWHRRKLLFVFNEMRSAGEEGTLDVHGISTRASALSLSQAIEIRCAEWIAICQAATAETWP